MGYYASYEGSIKFNKPLLGSTLLKLKDEFEEVSYDDMNREVTFYGYDKYYSDSVEKLLEDIKPLCLSGSIEYKGEDNCYWRFLFEDGEWIEENGLVYYESDLSTAQQDKEEFLGRIIDVMQDCLDDPKGKTIKGEWYDNIKEELENIMRAWKVFS